MICFGSCKIPSAGIIRFLLQIMFIFGLIWIKSAQCNIKQNIYAIFNQKIYNRDK